MRLWTEIDLESTQQLPAFLDTIVAAAGAEGVGDDITRRLGAASDATKAALSDHAAWLRDDVLPRATADWTAGPERFEEMVRLRELEADGDEILAVGEELLVSEKAARDALADEIEPGASPEEVADAVKDDHAATFGEALEEYRATMARARSFVVDHGLATPPDEDHLNIIETPSFIRHLIPFAAYYSPAKFDPTPVGTYIVTPPSSPEMMREHNRASIGNTSVHEAYPGHHLQLSAAVTNPSLVRLFSGAPEFAEGWAFYCERMMKEAGFDDSPKGWYIVHTDAIWRATRIILDVQLHRGLIGFDEAVDRLVAETGFERPAALAEVKRYTSTPTYQLSYLFGRHMIERLKTDVEREQGSEFELRRLPRHAALWRDDAGFVCAAALRGERPMRAVRGARIGLAAIVVLAACSAEPTPSPRPACPTEAPTTVSAQAILEDATLATVTVGGAVEGEFAFELYGDQAPIATANFVALARCGFYDGIWFHRILAGFVIQAGDPETKTHDAPFEGMGRGGAGYEFEIEPPAEGSTTSRTPSRWRTTRRRTTASSSSTLDRPRGPAGSAVHDLRPGRVGNRCDRRRLRRFRWQMPMACRSSSSRSSRSRFRADPRRFRQAIERAGGRKPLCNVKESQPQIVLSKRNRRSILTVLFAQRFITGRKAMGRLGLG